MIKKHDEEVYDMIIVGSGPAGLFAAFYAGLREMSVKIIESQPRLGGKVHVYPEKMIWDIGGLTPVTGQQLIEQMIEQGLTFNPTVSLSETVTQIDKNDAGVFQIETSQNNVHYAKTLMLAVGGGILDPIKLELEGADAYEHGNLYYSVKKMQAFKDKRVLISGGSGSAVDWANMLAPIAKQVTLIYRGDALKAHEADITKLGKNGVEFLTHTEIVECVGEGQHIHAATLLNSQTEETTSIAVDAVLVNHGYKRDQTLLRESQLDIDLKDGYFIQGTPNGESSIPGLYGAGDILSHEGKLNLIAGAYQDAVNAVNCAKQYLDPEANQRGLVSSHNHIFAEKNKKYLYGALAE
ncbi:NAD(P)/FAD-dependent oxidoreductase [Bacillaceae bacterium SIJ1]|uniref:NAD(P)/FAD-dependent oxidoreductase n=1 Tax=Litoribacterium kuwaitense TaxID=1398745 RepID=UPI0013ECCBE9|nr:NAD(P)/FAD-dependent oxidoreductase [Litoribacterium kuwaitense]NGP45639.1 NAD(P)/FAD-dependent oxidoreductase [Litoribacterium kuwaitense]